MLHTLPFRLQADKIIVQARVNGGIAAGGAAGGFPAAFDCFSNTAAKIKVQRIKRERSSASAKH